MTEVRQTPPRPGAESASPERATAVVIVIVIVIVIDGEAQAAVWIVGELGMPSGSREVH